MTSDQLRALLTDLNDLADEVERTERRILRQAMARLLDLADASGSEEEVALLHEVIRKARAALDVSARFDSSARQ